MPYKIVQHGDKFSVVAENTGRVAGTHPSKAKAQAQMAALYANEPEARKCMTCGCDDLGNDHHYISDVEKCSYCISKGQGPCWDGYQYAGTKEQDGKTVPNCIPVKKQIITGGSDWKIEFNTPDCQHGWSITKSGTGQSTGCYLTKEEAEKALEGLSNQGIDILGDEVRTAKSPEEIKEDSMKKSIQAESFWSGIFVPEGEALSGVNYGTLYQDHRYYFPSESTYDKDGKPNVGYGNSSGTDGRSL
jgi:hypothetical protein